MSTHVHQTTHSADHSPAHPTTFPDIVLRCRHNRGLTQRDFAQLFDDIVNASTIGVWERGGVKDLPRRDAILRLSELCDVAPGKLLDALGYWGSAGPDAIDTTPADSELAALLDAARQLPRQQLRALIEVVRAMRAH